MDYSSWYQSTYPSLSGHGIWLRGNEPNTLDIAEYDARPCRVLITRLSTYEDTADSFTHRLLYQCVREISGIFPDLAYLPPPRDGELMKEAGVPWLLGSATKRGPSGFDVIALSNAVVQEMLNVPVMLRNSGIALDIKDRLDDPALPLILMGGANAVNASLFIHDNPPVDGLFAGESLEHITRLFSICRDGKAANRNKRDILRELEEVEGFIRPDQPRPTHKPHGTLGEVNQALAGAPFSYAQGQAGRGSVQITQGCACFCGFCSESWVRKPMREEPVAEILRSAAAIKTESGLERLELYSFNFNMHRGLYQLIKGLVELVGTIGLKSQRFDLIASDPRLLLLLHAVGKSSLTCGLEGISPRMRRFLCKSLDETELQNALIAILGAPLRELKVFLIATGREEDDDYAQLQELVRFMRETLRQNGKKPRVIFSITPLVRFPWTPLQADPAPSVEVVAAVMSRVRGIIKMQGFEFRESGDLGDYWLSQALVRAQGNVLYQACLAAQVRTGFVYYREVTEGFLGAVREMLAQKGVSSDALLNPQPAAGESAGPPLIDTGVTQSFLKKQYSRALQYTDSGYCLGHPGADAKCLACGACATAADRLALTRKREKVPATVAEVDRTIRALRAREQEMTFAVIASEQARGLPREVISSVLASALMRTEPALVPWYRRSAGSYWGDAPGCEWVSGLDLIRQVWIDTGAGRVDTLLRDQAFVDTVNRQMRGWGVVVPEGPRPDVIQKLEITAPFACDPARWCAQANIRYTLHRGADGWYTLVLGAEALKKKVLSAMTYINLSDGTSHVRLTALAKFNAEEFARGAFCTGEERQWVRVAINAGVI